MMNMFLKPGQIPEEELLYSSQATVQTVLVLLALLSVPIMLFVKPLVLTTVYKKRGPASGSEKSSLMDDSKPGYSSLSSSDHVQMADFSDHRDDDYHSHEEDESFGELMIHQGIHTIEFVLGTVSNTASYLRLWALSLAHSELAKVFWEKIMMMGINSGNIGLIFVCFSAWAGISIAVLLLMDVLECFLHALRLHWVEFQNKFYEASGYSYSPFTLKYALQE